MKITIVSKHPPGGRCTLYMRYAKVIADSCGADIESVFPTEDGQPEPPALLVDGRLIAPSDGVILSPAEVYNGLGRADVSELLDRLEAVEAKFMEEL